MQFEDSTQTTAYPFHPWSLTPRYFTPDELVGVKSNGHIISQTCLIRRSALLEAGGFRPELRWHCDWFLNWVVAFRSGICHVPEPLAVMRLLSTSYSTGTRAWEEQRVVLDHLLHLLKDPQYRDIRPYFSRSGILFSLNDRQAVVRTVLENHELCDSDTRGMVVEMLERAYGRDLGPPRQPASAVQYSSEYLGPKVSRLVDRWKASNRRVVIFGAGDHTANLFQWTTLADALLVGLVDSNPSLHGQWYQGLEITHPDRIKSLRPDVILISSQAYQEAIYQTLRPLEVDGIEIVRLYATTRG